MRCFVLFAAFLSFVGCMPDATDQRIILSPDMPDKRIALSYDDAPRGDGRLFSGPERTDALIAQWKKAETGPVAIFATPREAEDDANYASSRARLERYAAAGHVIANHSYSHPWASRTDIADYLTDIDTAESLLSGLENRRPWFRFPYLDEGGYGDDEPAAIAKRDSLRAGLADRGILSGYVTIDTYDWHLDTLLQRALRDGRTVDQTALGRVYADMVVDAAAHYDAQAMDVLGRRPAHMLLLHENDVAAMFTGIMVDALRADGWTIIHPDEAFADPIADIQPNTRFSGKGRIAAIARDMGREGAAYFDHWSSSEAGIEAQVEAAGVFTD